MECGLFDTDHLHRLRILRICNGLAYRYIRSTGYDYNVPCLGFFYRHAFESFIYKYLIYLLLDDLTAVFGYCESLSFADDTLCYSSDTKPSDVIIVSKCRNL